MVDIPKDVPWRTGMFFWDDCGAYWLVVSSRNGGVCANYDNPGGIETLDSFHTKTPDLNDPATVGALLGAVRDAYGESTLHPRPVLLDTLTNTGPQVVWYIERAREDDHEWLRTNGMWGAMVDGHKAPAISMNTEAAALLAAWAARPVTR